MQISFQILVCFFVTEKPYSCRRNRTGHPIRIHLRASAQSALHSHALPAQQHAASRSQHHREWHTTHPWPGSLATTAATTASGPLCARAGRVGAASSISHVRALVSSSSSSTSLCLCRRRRRRRGRRRRRRLSCIWLPPTSPPVSAHSHANAHEHPYADPTGAVFVVCFLSVSRPESATCDSARITRHTYIGRGVVAGRRPVRSTRPPPFSTIRLRIAGVCFVVGVCSGINGCVLFTCVCVRVCV